MSSLITRPPCIKFDRASSQSITISIRGDTHLKKRWLFTITGIIWDDKDFAEFLMPGHCREICNRLVSPLSSSNINPPCGVQTLMGVVVDEADRMTS